MAPAHARPGLPSLGSALTKAMAGTAAAALRLDVQALFEQRGRMMQIATALPDLALVPERAMVHEGVSGGFEWVVDCVASHPNFPLKLLIGEQMSLRLLQADGTYKPWHGYVMEAAQLGSDGGLSRYRLVMRPWLAFLAHRHDAFIYREKTVEEIVADVFADHPQANFRFELQRPMPARSVCTQYRESDLAFVERLLAEEGLCTWYEHDAHGPDLAVARHALHRLVITDRFATLPHLGPVRYAMQHPTARLPEQRDSITAFAQHCRVQTQSVVRGSWRPRVLVGSSAERTSAAALALGDLPVLEDYDGAGEDRHLDPLHADDVAERHLAALELGLQTHEGDGGARHLEAGRRFTLWDHGALDGDYTLLSIDHHITNNLGAQAARLLAATDLAHGAYRNHFLAVPAERPLVPRARTRPALPGTQTAWIVGHDSPVHTDRDHRVIVQFAWQRGQRPLPGGLPHDPSSPDGSGHAPADDRSTPWVRVALPWAGENWGAVAVPRIGTEVLVAFIEGDIDRPVIVGSLYSGGHRPPFSAGIDSGAGHAGMLSGWHSDALDGGGFNQWVLDDTTGQLRMRLLCHYTLAEVGLGHLIQQAPSGARRGPWRGGGFELGCQAWMTLRGVKGLMLSTHARPGRGESAQGAQLDAQELLARMHGHRQLGQTLHQAAAHAQAQGLSSHLPGHAWDAQHEATDPHRKGHHPPAVGGQDSRQPAPGGDSPT
jgi:type VI secretion system secreted protein VgrG